MRKHLIAGTLTALLGCSVEEPIFEIPQESSLVKEAFPVDTTGCRSFGVIDYPYDVQEHVLDEIVYEVQRPCMDIYHTIPRTYAYFKVNGVNVGYPGDCMVREVASLRLEPGQHVLVDEKISILFIDGYVVSDPGPGRTHVAEYCLGDFTP